MLTRRKSREERAETGERGRLVVRGGSGDLDNENGRLVVGRCLEPTKKSKRVWNEERTCGWKQRKR